MKDIVRCDGCAKLTDERESEFVEVLIRAVSPTANDFCESCRVALAAALPIADVWKAAELFKVNGHEVRELRARHAAQKAAWDREIGGMFRPPPLDPEDPRVA